MVFGFRGLPRMSDDELVEQHEQLRQRWVSGDGSVREQMHRIDAEMTRRANKRYDREHPDAKTRRSEHGWHLPSDD